VQRHPSDPHVNAGSSVHRCRWYDEPASLAATWPVYSRCVFLHGMAHLLSCNDMLDADSGRIMIQIGCMSRFVSSLGALLQEFRIAQSGASAESALRYYCKQTRGHMFWSVICFCLKGL
jgi:hypothetical protein